MDSALVIPLPEGWEWVSSFPVWFEYNKQEKDWYVFDRTLYAAAFGDTREEAAAKYGREVVSHAQKMFEDRLIRKEDVSLELGVFNAHLRWVGTNRG